MSKKQKKMLWRIAIASVILLLTAIIPMGMIFRTLFSLIAYLVIGFDVLKKAWRGILNRRVFDENFLMAIATVGAIALAFYEKSGDFFEAIAVMLFYQIGEFFQSYAVGKSRKNISDLMDIRPDYANIEEDGVLKRVAPDEVQTGSIIVVQPGEKIPIDGIVTEGSSSLNTSALTGESMPREIDVNDEVYSGCINITGLLKVKTTKEFGQSTVSKILELVEESSSRKSKSEQFISKFARIYTPAVCICALLLAVLPPFINILFGNDGVWIDWIYRALTFLVISCPCALVISIPLGFFGGIGGASRVGILIKGSNYIETLSKVRTVVFDKTGTLTEGVFKVVGVHHNNLEEEKLLEYTAYAECASSHPISLSLKEAYGKEIDRSRITDFEELAGGGVIATVDGVRVAVGNDKLMKKLDIEPKSCHSPGTVCHIAINGEYAGHIIVADKVKITSKETILKLKGMGIKKTIMLTGDIKDVAENVASELGIDTVFSELLPKDKVDGLEKIIESSDGKVAFVGDGINDAPVLTMADVGIAMGAMGSDAAIEAADVVLMDDNPLKIVNAIQIARKCIRIVYENIIFALGIKAVFLVLGAIGVANMWYAIFADVGVMVLAVINSIRTLKFKADA